jgi:hypothetical protein
MVMQGGYTEVYPGSSKGKPYVQQGGGVLYFLAPKCLRRGYKLCERESSLGLKGKMKVQRRLLEMLIFFGGMETGFSLSVFPCPFVVEPLPALL